MLTGQRAYLTAVATSSGRVLAVPVAQLRVVMAHEPDLSDLIGTEVYPRLSNRAN